MKPQPSYPTPLEMFYHWEATSPEKVFLRQPIQGEWREWTWQQAGLEIRKIAASLEAMKMPRHSHIAILSKNCAHWIMTDLAIMMAGHVSVPLYPNLTAGSIRKILEHCDAPLIFVGKLDGWASMKEGLVPGMQCVSFPYYGQDTGIKWEDLLKQHEPMREKVERADAEPGTLIYTSGSTGVPKGVMHKIGNFGFAAYNAVSYVGLTQKERFFSYLPLAHIAERFFVELGCLYSGGLISFTESLEKFPDDLRNARPTLFLGVPRIWKKFQEGILGKISQRKLNILLSLPIISGLIKKKIRQGMGFQDTWVMFTGASPIPKELLLWFRKIGFVIAEGYAMTENFAYGHGSRMEDARPGFVGHLLNHVEMRLAEDNEVQIRHQGLMDGYYREPELTREAFTEDGFLRTGDRGEVDKNGYLRIIGRTKEVFKTSKGKYVVPSPIEMRVGDHADIEMSCVTGESLPQPIVLITLTEVARGKDPSSVKASLEHHIREVNEMLDPHEKIGKAVVLAESWTIENEMLTPTLKLKRREIETRYADRYVGWYQEEGFVVW